MIMALLAGIRHVIHAIGFALLGVFENNKTTYAINCYPHKPWPTYLLWNMAHVCGFRLSSVKNSQLPTILFKDATTIDPSNLPAEASAWINGKCLDITKSNVAKIFTEITHRDLLVDPEKYHGPMVKKSEKNASHDGQIIEGPITNPDREYVYERLINNKIENKNEIEDLRVVIVGSQIPLVYRIRRPANDRFKSYGKNTIMATTNDVLNAKEQEELLAIARKIHLDFGEMDVLRDKTDSHIYVVDINKTTISPPADLSYQEIIKALRAIGRAFEYEFPKLKSPF